MPNEAAQAIIDKALSSKEAYDEMARQEAAVWGKFSVNPRVAAERAADVEAANKLNVNRGKFSFVQWCQANNLQFERGLSVGCGGGRAEQTYIASGICKSFHGIDIAEDSIEAAKKAAQEKDLDCTYEVGDINFLDLGNEEYDLVVAQTSLHHLTYLEDVFDRINKAMTADGVFWLHDFCGESQFQHSDKRLEIANAVLKCLPEEVRRNRINNITTDELRRREPGTLISPFESIRSGEIVGIAKERFEVVAGETNSAILHLVCPVGTRQSLLGLPNGQAIFDLIWTIDRQLLDNEVLTGTEARLVLKKKTYKRANLASFVRRLRRRKDAHARI